MPNSCIIYLNSNIIYVLGCLANSTVRSLTLLVQALHSQKLLTTWEGRGTLGEQKSSLVEL